MSLTDDLPLVAAGRGLPADRVRLRLRDRRVIVLDYEGRVADEMDADAAMIEAQAERERRRTRPPRLRFSDHHMEMVAEIQRRADRMPR